jgi:hypothetical protein
MLRKNQQKACDVIYNGDDLNKWDNKWNNSACVDFFEKWTIIGGRKRKNEVTESFERLFDPLTRN